MMHCEVCEREGFLVAAVGEINGQAFCEVCFVEELRTHRDRVDAIIDEIEASWETGGHDDPRGTLPLFEFIPERRVETMRPKCLN